ncbi:hypothetical protein NAI78_11540, partial [Francisella tularensis subsp. holarctica]|nr:hypothetical protein [Francisella tularensis subsp. holarctica]
DFKYINTQWLGLYKKTTINKTLKPLEKFYQIHYKMIKKYIRNFDSPFKETIYFSPLNFIFYSI